MKRLAILAVALLSACAATPPYGVPSTPDAPAFKEAAGWAPAAPADALDRGPWWQLFDDPVLSALAARVQVSNQNVAAAAANYAQAQATVREQRAALFPAVNVSLSASRTGGGRGGGNNDTQAGLALGGTWAPDVWGRLRAAVTAAGASAQASAADLASATLSAQGELVIDYLSLRQTDAQSAILDATIAAYERARQITENRYDAGIVPKTDLLQAETQLANARADRVGLDSARAQYEHAIAVLVGEAPANFTLAPAPWRTTVPAVPAVLPSALLQRRPDIAAAERRVAAANAQIGIARSAYFPTLGLSASTGPDGTSLSALFGVTHALWSVGLSATQVLFDAGAIGARVEGARAAYDATVASYRQTVLAAFQNVEDQLATASVLAQQDTLRRQASTAADQVEAQVLNRYRAGQVGYTDVVTAQATALGARRALVQSVADRQTAAVALIQALGGGWNADAIAAPGAR